MRRILLLISFVIGACSSDIIARGDTRVVLGQDAPLSCALTDPSGVKQVTWQRVRGDGSAQTLATFSEIFKDQVADQFVGKVALTLGSFNATSIVIRNVTFEDEACYVCSFKVYPSGPKRETLCLTVTGISKIMASVTASDADVTVSCSATGKPAPTLQWRFTEEHLNLPEPRNSSELNRDASTTSTSNLTLPLSRFRGKHVECVAQSNSTEDRYQIYIPGGDVKENKITSRTRIIIIVVLVVILIIISVIIIIFCCPSSSRKLKGGFFQMKSTHLESLSVEEC